MASAERSAAERCDQALGRIRQCRVVWYRAAQKNLMSWRTFGVVFITE